MGLFEPATAVADLGGSVFNTAMALENQSYNRKQTDITRAREDNAVQRRVADLKAAGLSPTLAAGSAAAVSSPIRSETPEWKAPDILKGIEYENAKKQGAMTDAQIAKLKMDTLAADAARNKSLMDTQLSEANRDAVRANSLPARLLQMGIEMNALNGKGGVLTSALFNKALNEALAASRAGEDTVRNSDMARRRGFTTNDPDTMRILNQSKLITEMANSKDVPKGQGVVATLLQVLKSAGSFLK